MCGKKTFQVLTTMAMFGFAALLYGCDKEVSHEKKTEIEDGKVKTQETTVKETPEGNIIIEEKTTEKDYPQSETESETKTKEYTPPPQ